MCYACSVQTVNGMRLFTTTGYKYFRSFQISLCAGGGDDGDFPPATCLSNASLDMQVCLITKDVFTIVYMLDMMSYSMTQNV